MATHRKPAKNSGDAIELLRADHQEVNHLFDEFEHAESTEQKKDLASRICNELTVHAMIEEEIFYPAVKQVLKDEEDKDLVPEAQVEHSMVKTLIAEVEGLEPEDEMFDARIKVMSEYVKHHVQEEQDKIFPKAKAAKLDMMQLGKQLSERKAELMEVVSA